ncbi:J domain-containing protein [Georgenia muralis]|uniref:Nuclease-like protein n=1 Tax=Georgenia muralis TaxID=154117 RepID=A0A3N4Z7E9_9MICO|nr:DnaJ domain-containing protein [Georgenia muralis]RPF27776.1 nuclease-like protein [Georgenia muralis]
MPDGPDSPYAVLGVDRRASAAELRRAYRRRQRKTHPDLGGDPVAFHAVQVAWERIGTPAARAAYDREAAGAPHRPGGRDEEGTRTWTSGTRRGSARAPSRARSYGHPGGASRQRFLTLVREWAGRGTALEDPYDEDLLARAPVEIRHALADALAEESTARTLGALGASWVLWHDVVTEAGEWTLRPGAPVTDPPKIDHVALGPTGLFLVQSEDWGAPVTVRGSELVSPGLPPGEEPVRAFERRARIVRSWRVAVAALVVVLPDDALAEDVILLRRAGWRHATVYAVRRRALGALLSGGTGRRIGEEEFFAVRDRLNQVIRFV